MQTIKGKYTEAKIFTDNLEDMARQQIQELCDQKAFEGATVRIMPDTHAGKGCVIGFTAQLGDRVVPNLVGVDIGCGMQVVDLGFINIDFAKLDDFIRNHVPHGNSIHQKLQDVSDVLLEGIERISEKTGSDVDRHLRSVGSLGGGNHFIEINEDKSGKRYLVIHSGSRNLGAQVAKYHQKRAEQYVQSKLKELQDRKNRAVGLLKAAGDTSAIPSVVEEFQALAEVYQVPSALAFLEGEAAEDYLQDMYVAQDFAMANRENMCRSIVEFLGKDTGSIGYLGLDFDKLGGFTSVHNYTDPDDRIIRKGAIRAEEGQKVIVPISMKEGSILAYGKGNSDWNNSAPHGAGRLLSRTAAKAQLSLDDFQNSMKGVWTSSVGEKTLDEAPLAYKPLQEILDNTVDSLEVIEVIKPLYNFKA